MKSLHLVRATPNQHVVETLEALLADARAGKITGLAYITLERAEHHTADVIGRAKTAPIVALGLLRLLEEAVAKLI